MGAISLARRVRLAGHWAAVRLAAAMVVVGFLLGGLLGACTTTDCGPATCPGCCASDGSCVRGESSAGCGQGGEACLRCTLPDRCLSRACTWVDAGPPPDGGCGCAVGCCRPDGGCGLGNVPEACGPNRDVCEACEGLERCDGVRCTTAACAGCVDPFGLCRAGTEEVACGVDGGLCAGCLAGQRCVAGACVDAPCNVTTCASGCCTLTSQCVVPSTGACGNFGAPCQRCDGGTTCVQGACQ